MKLVSRTNQKCLQALIKDAPNGCLYLRMMGGGIIEVFQLVNGSFLGYGHTRMDSPAYRLAKKVGAQGPEVRKVMSQSTKERLC